MSDRQDELLKRSDWRYFAIDKVGTGLGSIATEERLQSGKLVGFGLPSAPGLFLNMAWAAHRQRIGVDVAILFDDHPESGSTFPDDQGPLFDFFEISMSEIVNSYSAIEAFANEVIPAGYVHTRAGKGGSPSVQFTKDEIERRLPLDEKLKRVLPTALNKESPTGSTLWPQYLALQDLRDSIIHLKTIDRRPSGPEDATIWGCLLRLGPVSFPETAAAIIGHFCDPARRWFNLRPRA